MQNYLNQKEVQICQLHLDSLYLWKTLNHEKNSCVSQIAFFQFLPSPILIVEYWLNHFFSIFVNKIYLNRLCLLKMPALLQIARLYQIQVCILYLIVYNFTRFKCARNCTSQDHSRHIIVRYHTHTLQKTRPANQRSQRDSQIAILFQLITFTWTLINQLAKYCTHNLLVWRNSTNTWFWRMQRIFLLFLDIFDLLNPKSEWCKCVHVERS